MSAHLRIDYHSAKLKHPWAQRYQTDRTDFYGNTGIVYILTHSQLRNQQCWTQYRTTATQTTLIYFCLGSTHPSLTRSSHFLTDTMFFVATGNREEAVFACSPSDLQASEHTSRRFYLLSRGHCCGYSTGRR